MIRRLRITGHGRDTSSRSGAAEPRDPAIEQVHRLTDELAVPRPWDLEVFLGQVTALAHKRIQLVPLYGGVAERLPCGLVVERADDVVIAYDANTSGYHADHIVLHEIGHLLLGHLGGAPNGPERAFVRTLFPNLDQSTVLRVLARGDYDGIAEHQAELFASLVMSEARTAPVGSPFRHVLFDD